METRNIAAIISDTRAGINRYLLQELKRLGIEGLAPSHGAILYHLFNNEEVTMKDLAKAVRRDKSTVTALVGKLVANGYVDKVSSTLDQRTVYVKLSQRGQALQPVFEEVSRNLIDQMWRGVDDAEQRELVRLLKKIRANLP
ncbi:MarR family transcriptional regulator [Geomonas oryzisoli]|uniref:MarR family transcriptional regulator n=1 Tax=Geomonas oryzisoli TaxID=2847992 RepID=A0ABX8J7J4_9BACT|nr:MarR family transcriptional regulator [Geomonas oryzisoli]QWV93793.1 MarR family transcriptional regulator [Geomonas oryzisoli]